MSAKEPYDYLPTITADYDYTLTLRAQDVITESGFKNQVVHMADDNSEEVVTISVGSIFYADLPFTKLSESDMGTIMDLYHDPAKANAMGRTFRFASYDGHVYVVRFDCKLDRSFGPLIVMGIPTIRFRLKGKIVDA